MRARLRSWLGTRRRVALAGAGALAMVTGIALAATQLGGDEPTGPPEVPEVTIGGVSDTDRHAFIQLTTAARALEGFATQLTTVPPAQRRLVTQQLRPTALNLSLLRPRSKSLRRVRSQLIRALERATKGADSSKTAQRLRQAAGESRRRLLDYARGKPTLRPPGAVR